MSTEHNDDTNQNEVISYDDIANFDFGTLSDEEYDSYLETGTLPDKYVDNSKSSKVDEEEEEEEEESNNEDDDKDEEEDKEASDTEEEEEENESESEEQDNSLDYKQEYSKLVGSPIKAGGTEITLESVDEVLTLVQKGADYTRKMQMLKPFRKYTEAIQENKISESDFNFLMDLHKGDKDAIQALLSKNNIDVLDLELDEDTKEKSKTYTPKTKTVDDSTIDMNDVIDTVKNSEYADSIKALVNGGWDEASINEIMNKPSVLHGLYEEFTLGRFEKINKKVVRDRLLKSDNIPDLQRYVAYLQEEMKEQPDKEQAPTPKVKQQSVKEMQNKPKAKLQSNKKSSTLTNDSKVVLSDDVSDDDFEKSFDEWFKAQRKQKL